MAEAYYKDIPTAIMEEALQRLPGELMDIIGEFELRF